MGDCPGLSQMTKNTLDHSTKDEDKALRTYRMGIRLGRASLESLVLGAPLCYLCYFLVLPLVLIIFSTGLAGVVLTKGRSVSGRIGLGLLFLWLAFVCCLFLVGR